MFKKIATVLCLASGTYLLTPSLLLAHASDFAEIVEEAKHGTVGILKQADAQSTSPDRNSLSVRGSGIYLGDGYILTARHATKRQGGGATVDPPHISVISSTLKEASATLIGVNQFLDVALYHIPQEMLPRGLSARTFSQVEALPGEQVFTVGYPLGLGACHQLRIHRQSPYVFANDSITSLASRSFSMQWQFRRRVVQYTRGNRRPCPRDHSNRNDPGGTSLQPICVCRPGPLVHKIVTALIQGKPFHFSKLGLQLTSVKIGQQWHMAVAQATGPARRAGFKKGDILLSIDNQPVDSANQLKTYLIEQTRPFQPVSIRVLRDHKEKLIRVVLGKA